MFIKQSLSKRKGRKGRKKASHYIYGSGAWEEEEEEEDGILPILDFSSDFI